MAFRHHLVYLGSLRSSNLEDTRQISVCTITNNHIQPDALPAANISRCFFDIILKFQYLLTIPKFYQILMKTQSTLENSPTWKSLHGGSYLFGGVCFIFGSFALFPSLAPYINTAIVSAWFYSVGSVYIFLSDLAEWMHYTLTGSPLLININFFLTVIGSLLILVGSMMLLPMISSPVIGNIIYAVGSGFIFLSQTWKLVRTFSQKGKTAKEIYEQDVYGVLLDISQGLGGLFYTIGTFVLMQAAIDPDYTVPGVILYCFGGIFYAGSGFFLNCRYYQNEKKECSNTKSPFWQHNWY